MTKVHPPFDPDVAAALVTINGVLPSSITPELIGRLREVTEAGYTLSLEEIRRHVHADELTAHGPAGDTAVPLLVMRPHGSDPAAQLPGLYFIHGGGMVAGNNRTGVDWVLGWMAEIPMVAVSVDYRLARNTRIRRPSRTATRGWNGWAATSASSESIPTGS